MRGALLILGVLAITFALVIAAGVSWDGDARSGDWLGKPPPVSRDGKPDEDALANWKVPPLGEALAPLLAPFAPRLDISRSVAVIVGPGEAELNVGRAKAEFQTAHLTLTEGDAARVTSHPVDEAPKATGVCLCRAGALVEAGLFAGCGARWLSDRAGPPGYVRCRAGDEKTALVLGTQGGRLDFAAGASTARVAIR